MMRIDIITIFPKMFTAVLGSSILKRAQEKGKVSIFVHNLRDFACDKHRTVDDRPFGGGPGMVMKPEPLFLAVEHIKKQAQSKTRQACPYVILLCPQGEVFNQDLAKRISRRGHIILICGHYEGVDERVRQKLVDKEISIGDYVLTGGELPAMVLVDVIVRLIPGVLGDKNSLNFESFEGNLLEHPQYTRPQDFRGMRVPKVLLSGDHKRIALWRQREALKRTRQRRPDLLNLKKGDSQNG